MRRTTALFSILLISLSPAMGQTPAQDPAAGARIIETSAGAVRVETVAAGLENPWGLAILPDGRMLVTERPGRLRLVTRQGSVSAPIAGAPAVSARGQGGLLDVAASPTFAKDRLVYLAFAEPGPDGTAGTALWRGRLTDDARLDDGAVIFRQTPKVDGGQHFGARIVFGRDGTIFLTLGDRGKFAPAQDPASGIGKVVRIRPDGSPAKDNPFVGRADHLPEIFSLGHRNIQGAALHPATGELWVSEMGPRGGDEINLARAGRNYGWPLVSAGDHYDGRPIPKPQTRPDLAPAAHVFAGTVAPSGMTFYTGEAFPGWRGSMVIGGLAARAVIRLSIDGERASEVERIALNARVRDVRAGPHGALYVLTDASRGALLRLSPARP